MIFIGMIYRYDDTQGTGDLMLADGEKREFSSTNWEDSENTPSVGQRISYIVEENHLTIRVATEEDISNATDPNVQPVPQIQENVSQEEESSTPSFTSLDEYLNHYVNLGFRQLKDVEDNGIRTITFRYYDASSGDFAEAIIKQKDSNITVEQTLNGKPI